MITVNIKANPGLYEACKIVNRKDKRKYKDYREEW